MGEADEVSDRYVDAVAALDPCLAAALGVAGHDAGLTDYGPDACAARDDLNRRTRAELAALEAGTYGPRDPGTPPVRDRDGPRDGTPDAGRDRAPERDAERDRDAGRLAARILREYLDHEIEAAEAGVTAAALGSLENPVRSMHRSIELLDRGAATPWPAVLSRLRAMPGSLAGLRATLATAPPVAARRQVRICARQCEQAAGYLGGLPRAYGDGPLRADLDAAVAAAGRALAETAAFLRDDHAPRATERDALGRDRYELGLGYFTGARLDLDELYAWGWDELARLDRRIREVTERIAPGRTLPEAVDLLGRDPRHRVTGPEAFRAWTQDVADRAIADLDGVHFDIPAPLRRIECRVTSIGDGAYYLPPPEDLTRPGQVWWTVTGDDIPTWLALSTVFHEGVPGHHLQQGLTACGGGRLNRFRRTLAEWAHAGHVEGWALYAEGLMAELGHVADPAHLLGMLAGQQWVRAARVVLDIGLHLELPIPPGTGFHEGARWTRELGLEFLRVRGSMRDAAAVRYEVDRYLGLPGQAASYKVGERVWLEVREEARRRQGAAFDLKAFHAAALDLGSMGLDTFRAELWRVPDGG